MHQVNDQNVSLLMLASLNGYDAVVRVLLHYCPTQINQTELKGNVQSINGDLIHNATALWCALDRAHFTVAQNLISLGKANVKNGPTHSLLIDAIIRNRFDIVRFLIENGYADVNETTIRGLNKNSGLLIAAAHDNTEIMAYLIEKGASIDYITTYHRNTPLSTAVIKRHLASVKLLCKAGASTSVKNRYGQTPLTLAAESGRLDIMNALLEYNHDETIFDDLELFAASYLAFDNFIGPHESEKMLNILRQSIQSRLLFNIPKNVAEPIAAYDFYKECQSIDELNQIEHDNNRLYIEALLIRERILKPRKSLSLFTPLLDRVILLVEKKEFDRGLHLAFHTFHLYQQMRLDTNLHRFVWIFCRILTANVPFPVDHFLKACNLIFEPSQQKPGDANLNNALFLVIIASKVLKQTTLSNTDRRSIVEWIRQLCCQRRTTPRGQTLLHLSVDPQTNHNITYRQVDIRPIIVFPNLAATKLLLTYGKQWVDVNATDAILDDTALHLVSRSSKQDTNADSLTIIKVLLNEGAHVDCMNENGQTPLAVAKQSQIQNLLQSKQSPPRLKCLCTRLVVDQKLDYERLWPVQTHLYSFILLHDYLRRKISISQIDSN
ncbi:unnamed protein product [Rotaria sp. Silwood2]|nr:unnamed protein product [Rotaria sp. Silwood2]CAF2911579.1 unnamed protein product [Rotaria sp. Silwood2]CAF3162596.1 unnamed protein product [Rotaria sp. Silwood2]CAF3306573.1 unnamed protein product [Rotaria sp. Silwood2]CAF4078435.1 unnamed protein product [Rotaria sp. Silwood2]